MTAAVALRPMKETVRRRKLNKALNGSLEQVIAVIAALLATQYRALDRDIRRGNFRKRLIQGLHDVAPQLAILNSGAAATDAEQEAVNYAVQRVIRLNWSDWLGGITDGIRNALTPVVSAVQDVESEYWLTRGGAFDAVDPTQVIAAYEARIGEQITNISEETKNQVLTDITKWFNEPDKPFSELIDTLKQTFDPKRAELIARTESAHISAQVTRDAMTQFGIEKWQWDLGPERGEWPCDECVDMSEGGPYRIDDPMPPLHPNCRCGVAYASDDTEIEE